MGLDREAAIRAAEKALRQGSIHGAIEQYLRLIADQPRDWNTINALGDLYLRVGDTDTAAAQFTRVADFLYDEGFIPRAAALYKKTLKIKSGDRHVLLRLAEIAARQGLVAESKLYLRQLTDPPAQPETAGPADTLLDDARRAIAAGDETSAHAALTRLLAIAPGRHADVVRVADELRAAGRIEDAYRCLEVAVDAALLESAYDRAATLLQTFAGQTRHVPALERLVAACIEGGFEDRRRVAEAEIALLREFAGEPVVPPAENFVSPAEPVAMPEPVVEEIDLTTLLDEPGAVLSPAPAAAPKDLETVFEEMRARSADASSGSDASVRYDAAMTHLAAGRIGDAVAALKDAARAPVLRFTASARLGRLYAEGGDLPSAIDWLERAAEAPAPSVDEAYGVLYELADVLERIGESARALAVLLEIETDAGDFRDVRDRVARLSRAQEGSVRA